jgi:hypothetical protein
MRESSVIYSDVPTSKASERPGTMPPSVLALTSSSVASQPFIFSSRDNRFADLDSSVLVSILLLFASPSLNKMVERGIRAVRDAIIRGENALLQVRRRAAEVMRRKRRIIVMDFICCFKVVVWILITRLIEEADNEADEDE